VPTRIPSEAAIQACKDLISPDHQVRACVLSHKNDPYWHTTAEKLYFEKNDEPAIVLRDGGMSLIAKSVGTEVAGFDISHEQTAQKVAELAEMGPGVVRTWAWDAKSIGWKFCMVFRRGEEFHMCMPVYRCS
jgi:hypothetical protein